MIYQIATFYTNFLIKSFKEYINGNLNLFEEFDLFGNTTYFRVDDNWIKWEYNDIGKIIKETNSGGQTLIIEYYNNGYGNKKLAKSINKNGDWSIIQYSITGEIICSYDNLGNHSNF